MKNAVTVFLILFVLSMNNSFSQTMQKGIFNESKEIGNDLAGISSDYLSASQTYHLEGQQKNKSEHQGFTLTTQMKGSFLFTAKIKKESNGTGGLIITTPSGEIIFKAIRNTKGNTFFQSKGKNQLSKGPKSNYEVLQLERIGSRVNLYACGPNEPLQLIGESLDTTLPEIVSVGLWLETSPTFSKVIFSEVRLDNLVAYDYDGDKSGHLGSRLEIIDINTNEKRVVYESMERFEAPNFLPNGKELLFNMNGSLYTVPVAGGEPKKFDTGFAIRNNNDHGISFDGKLLAISHHREGLPGGGSTVYVMPLSGGEPKLVTEETPSYWHGWNPNNQEVVYVGQRKGSSRYQLYKKNISGGQETPLTYFEKGHVDGPEYSPDGKFIYYNGSQTGTMQLWRMNPEGQHPEQLTFDELNNWFPHLSPDGKWMAYLAFPPDIHPDDHPAYKKVQLKLMPAAGGAPRVLTHLYGGQGTINVPSWSPDSRYIAFVSNAQLKKK